jgi:hypothetical protein
VELMNTPWLFRIEARKFLSWSRHTSDQIPAANLQNESPAFPDMIARVRGQGVNLCVIC